MTESCNRCGGGMDGDHPTLCRACCFEFDTGLVCERAVDAAHEQGITLAEFAKRNARRRRFA